MIEQKAHLLPKKSILLLGSGLMAESVVIHLLRRKENKIHIASNIVADAEKIAKKHPHSTTFSEVNVEKRESLEPLVKNCDLVISYIPNFLHIHVAKVCLELKKHLVTASYVSKQMKEMESDVQEAGLIFLNEVGLDPGIDHLSTMKIINEVKENNGTIVEYESWCGGLPSPQFCDNPLGYKFTWSPIGVLRAANNDAKFIQFKNEYTIPSADLLYNTFNVEVNPALSFEGYANRNSINYKDIYGLKDAEKVIRGTLRYKGYCTIVAAFKELGLLKEEPVKGTSWVEYLKLLLLNQPAAALGKDLVDQELTDLVSRIVHKTVYAPAQYIHLSNEEKEKKVKKIVSALKFFDLVNPLVGFHKPEGNVLQNLVHLLESKIKLRDGEADLVAMQHIFKVKYVDKPSITLKSSMLLIGDKHGQSAMSKTVAIPTAIGAQMILDGKIKARGVIIPTQKEIYGPMLQELEEMNIRLVETIE